MRHNPHLEAIRNTLDQGEFVQLEAGERVTKQRDGSPQLGFVIEGMLKGVVHPQHGTIDHTLVSVVGDEQWFGAECIPSGHNIEYVTMIESRVRLFPLSWFHNDAPEAVVRAVLYDAAWELARTLPLHYIGKLTLRQRVLSRLCDIRDVSSLPEIKITHGDLASLVGVHRNKVGIVLRELEDEGLVECHYGEILLGPREALFEAYRR